MLYVEDISLRKVYEKLKWLSLYLCASSCMLCLFFGSLALESLIYFRPALYLLLRVLTGLIIPKISKSYPIVWDYIGLRYLGNRMNNCQTWFFELLNKYKIYQIHGLKSKYNKPVLFLYHPHGIFVFSMILSRLSPQMIDTTICATNVVDYLLMPKIMDIVFCGRGGKLSGTSKSTMSGIMKSRRNLTLCPGGFEEASLHTYTNNTLYLQKRMGFVKLCLKYGYNPVIAFGFGENKTYVNLQGLRDIRLKIAKLGIPTVIFTGIFWLIPLSLNIRCVLSDPIEFPHIDEPSDQDVKKYHTLYISKLKKFYEDNCHEGDGKLILY
tara:strand:+ start:800 stop:1771 length:972 start_codon:yes stop_codon:yes gene_type:complete